MFLFNKKINKEEVDTSVLFEKNIVTFKNIYNFLNTYSRSGDWFISLSPDSDSIFDLNNQKIEKSNENLLDEDLVTTYDSRLLRLYRHKEDNLYLNNVRSILGTNESLKKRIVSCCKYLDFILKALVPKIILDSVCYKLRCKYDCRMIDENTNKINEIYIWIPIWKLEYTNAIIITVIDRIHFIIT